MATLRSSRCFIVTELLILLQWTTLSAAWVNLVTHIDLSWPPISVWRDFDNGTAASWPNMTVANGTYIGNTFFDCANFALDPNVARTDFPLTGGMVQLNFSAPSALQANENFTNLWTVLFKIGQFSGVDNNEVIGDYTWSPTSNLNNMTWTAEQFAASLGSWCSPNLDIPATINFSSETWTWDYSLPNKEELVGMNATLGIQIVKSDDSEGLDIGAMTQCSYIRFTNTTDQLGPCSSPSVLKPLPEPLPSPSAFPTANPSPTITPPSIVLHGDQSFMQDVIALGVICPLIFILIIGCCGWRKSRKRRRQRKTERSQGTHVETEHDVSEIGYKVEKHGHEVGETGHKVEEKLSGMSSSVKDDDSITVPPPNYEEALEDSKGERSKGNCLQRSRSD